MTIAFPGAGDSPAGTIASDAATITFGSGGLLDLAGGSIALGEGGSMTPADGDMSNGGTIVLGTGGVITFGATGQLATASGGIDAVEPFAITGSGSLAVTSAGSVRIGNMHTDGTIDIEAGHDIWDGFDEPPIDVAGNVTIRADGDVTWNAITGDPESMTLKAGGDINFAHDSIAPGSNTGQTGQSCSEAGTSGTTVYTYHSSSPDDTTISCLQPIEAPGQGDSGGSLGATAFVLLALAGVRRRRR